MTVTGYMKCLNLRDYLNLNFPALFYKSLELCLKSNESRDFNIDLNFFIIKVVGTFVYDANLSNAKFHYIKNFTVTVLK